MKAEPQHIIQFKITLRDSKPRIWRRVLVPDDITFLDLHHIFQIAMGWTNSHLFEFNIEEETIGFICDDSWDDLPKHDAAAIVLNDFIQEKNLEFLYWYDFGDSWEHDVKVESIKESTEKKFSPVCIDGKLNCPPEDCGGIHGFYEMLKILNNKNHPEYKETRIWSGRNYKPETFNIEKINKELPRYKRYVKHWYEGY